MLIMKILIGFVMLVAGRQIYWWFAGGVAFIAALLFGPLLSGGFIGWELTVIALSSGILLGILSTLLHRTSLALAGFLAGGYLLVVVPPALGWDTSWFSWPLFAVAGLVAAVFVILWLDLSLILLSGLTGAMLIVSSANFTRFNSLLAFLILAAFGMATQAVLMQYWPTSTEEE